MIFFSLLFLLTLSPFIQASNGGFGIELIHRDSPKSPFYNPNETPYQRIRNALQRSRRRASRFERAESKAFGFDGVYLMNISIGTPQFEIIGIADTGSDLIWTQCLPCVHCFKQDRPLFDPRFSQTYRNLPCTAPACKDLPFQTCTNKTCNYYYVYGNNDSTIGNLASETITLNSTCGHPVPFPEITFGCGHDNGGSYPVKTSGLVGLGGGPLSLVSQMGDSINWKFSHCLVPPSSDTTSSSTLYFGPNSFPQGPGVQSTPLFIQYDTFYYLSLESFSVGNAIIKMSGSSSQIQNDDNNCNPNIVIDSGTTVTLIPEDVLSDLSAVVGKLVTAKRAEDPHHQFSLCYTMDSFKKAPVVVAHFSGGADVKLDTSSTFLAVSEDVVCFAFVGAKPPSIFGSLALMNYLVAYDLKGRTVSFKQTDCAKTMLQPVSSLRYCN